MITLPGTTGATIQFVSETTPTNGKFNHGNITIALTRSGISSTGFNLIGNPYPSYLKWTKAFVDATTNPDGGTAPKRLIEPSIYVRTNLGSVNSGGDQNWKFFTYNANTNVVVPNHELLVDGNIPLMQAFWVRANEAGNLVLDNLLTRSHQSSNPLKAPAIKNTDRQFVRLEVSNGTRTDETLLLFDTNAADGYDGYDSPKYMEASSEVQIYTTTDTQKLVMNGMRNLPLDQEISLGFIPGTATTFSLKANEISNLPSDVKLILKDNATSIETDLTDGVSTYTFSPATFSGDRFSLLFKGPSITTGVVNPENEQVSVFVNAQNEIVINANAGSKYAIYNAVGQQLANGALNDKLQTINYKLKSGVYVVKVGNVTERIIIR